MKNIEDKVKRILSEKGMTIQRLAIAAKISEPTLHAIFNRDDAKLSQIEKIAEALGVPQSFFLEGDNPSTAFTTQTGFANISGTNNKQKIMPGDTAGQTSTTSQTNDLSAELADCRKDVQALVRELEVMRELVRAKDEMILLLKGHRDNPN